MCKIPSSELTNMPSNICNRGWIICFTSVSFRVTISPEAQLHFWLKLRWRLNRLFHLLLQIRLVTQLYNNLIFYGTTRTLQIKKTDVYKIIMSWNILILFRFSFKNMKLRTPNWRMTWRNSENLFPTDTERILRSRKSWVRFIFDSWRFIFEKKVSRIRIRFQVLRFCTLFHKQVISIV